LHVASTNFYRLDLAPKVRITAVRKFSLSPDHFPSLVTYGHSACVRWGFGLAFSDPTLPILTISNPSFGGERSCYGKGHVHFRDIQGAADAGNSPQ
jgi:hypothetical protein